MFPSLYVIEELIVGIIIMQTVTAGFVEKCYLMMKRQKKKGFTCPTQLSRNAKGNRKRNKKSLHYQRVTSPPKTVFPTTITEGKIYYFILEVGFYHYCFETERYIDNEDEHKLILNYTLFDKFRVDKDKRLSESPMSIVPASKCYFDEIKITDDDKKQLIENPILFATYIPKCIEAKDIWNNLYEYISSLRDKEFVDSRTNDEHIESNGFDKKISFRHRK